MLAQKGHNLTMVSQCEQFLLHCALIRFPIAGMVICLLTKLSITTFSRLVLSYYILMVCHVEWCNAESWVLTRFREGRQERNTETAKRKRRGKKQARQEKLKGPDYCVSSRTQYVVCKSPVRSPRCSSMIIEMKSYFVFGALLTQLLHSIGESDLWIFTAWLKHNLRSYLTN